MIYYKGRELRIWTKDYEFIILNNVKFFVGKEKTSIILRAKRDPDRTWESTSWDIMGVCRGSCPLEITKGKDNCAEFHLKNGNTDTVINKISRWIAPDFDVEYVLYLPLTLQYGGPMVIRTIKDFLEEALGGKQYQWN